MLALLVAALATTAAAQSATSALGSLSASCQASATGLVTSSFGSCANIIGLVGVISASGSIVTPLDSFLGGVCSQTCSAATLSTAAASVNSGCASDLASGNPIATALGLVTSNYTQVKDVLCLSAASNSTFCLTNLLNGVQTSTGQQINVTFLTTLLSGGLTSLGAFLAPVPASTLCTDCSHALVSKIAAFTPAASNTSSAASTISGKCGASFVDGQVPSSVVEKTSGSALAASGTNTASGSAGSAAATAKSSAQKTVVGAGMALVAGALVLLA